MFEAALAPNGTLEHGAKFYRFTVEATASLNIS